MHHNVSATPKFLPKVCLIFLTAFTNAFAPQRQVGAKSSHLAFELEDCKFWLRGFVPLVQNEALDGEIEALVRILGFKIFAIE